MHHPPSLNDTRINDTGSAEPPLGLTRLVLAARVARRHYLDDKSKIDIGAELGISRFQVARLLDLARVAGLIQITIREYDADAVGIAHGDSGEAASSDARGWSVA